MNKINRISGWIPDLKTVIFIMLVGWIACTQKNSVDPIKSIQGAVPFFVNPTASPSQIKIGGEFSKISARLLDQDGKPLANQTVKFSTDMGYLNSNNATIAEMTTNADGLVEVWLISGTQTGKATITLQYDKNTTTSITVQFTSIIDNPIVIEAYRNVLLGNGNDTTGVTIQIAQDLIDQATEDIVIHIQSTLGGFVSTTLNMTNGVGKSIFVTESTARDTIAVLTASYDKYVASTVVLLKGVQFYVEASPRNILADGKSTATIRAFVKETTTQIGILNELIQFGSDLGRIPSYMFTDESGVAEVELISGTTPGTAHVYIYYYSMMDTVNIFFQETLPSYLDISASPSIISADGKSKSVITATVTDANRSPVPDGTIVLFDIVEGSGILIGQQETLNGTATSELTSATTPDTVTIRVSVGNLEKYAVVYYTVGDAAQILVSTDADSIPADGITNATIQAIVLDAQGHALSGQTVYFSTSIGNITPNGYTNSQGIATVQFSSGIVGNATITATVNNPGGSSVSGVTTVVLLPGISNSIVLSFDPQEIGVKGTGKDQTTTITAEVKDSKNNPVEEGTLVRFSIIDGPGGESLSSLAPIGTKDGKASVSLSSGYRPGVVRIQASLVDSEDKVIISKSSEILIHAGPPYIEDINDVSTTHLTVGTGRLNICFAHMDTTSVTVKVFDKWMNPVQEGTAVYLTTSGGGITTGSTESPTIISRTDKNGVAQAILNAAFPQSDVVRFYDGEGSGYDLLWDPNLKTRIPGPIYDFEDGQVTNRLGDTGENDGIARIIATTLGEDMSGDSVMVWNTTMVVFSETVSRFELQCDKDTLSVGERATIFITIYDTHGNPIVAGSELSAKISPTAAQAELSWTNKITGDPGTCFYTLSVINAVDPTNPKSTSMNATISLTLDSQNGDAYAEVSIYMLAP